jgi:hypothetical protein
VHAKADPPVVARERRWEFVRAFVEQAWARPGADRPVARPHVVLLVSVLSAALAVVAGIILQVWRPAPLHRANPIAARSKSPGQYTAVSGWDCAFADDHGFEAHGRAPDWYTMATGGYLGDGCHGTYEVFPMSSKASQSNADQYALWWFAPAGMHRCEVQTFVPVPDPSKYQPVRAAQFDVMAGRGGPVFAQFVVDQSSTPGQWRPAGSFPVTAAGFAMRLSNRGASAGGTAKLAITQVKVECTG